MSLPAGANIYLPKLAVVDRVVDEIAEVKTFLVNANRSSVSERPRGRN